MTCLICELPKARGNESYCSAHQKRWYKFEKLGFTPEKFLELESIDRCQICGGGERPWLYVDHDHNCCGPKTYCSKCVRGILCPGCNTKMAALDQPEWLKRATKYKAGYQAVRGDELPSEQSIFAPSKPILHSRKTTALEEPVIYNPIDWGYEY